jgi:hypothetical protein
MRKILSFILFVFGLFNLCFAADESITITTYYPSPYGSYNSLQADRIGIGDNNASGSLTSADVPTTSGHMWVSGNVGIGTTNPLSRLSVGTSGNSNYAIAASGSSTGVYGSGDLYGLYGYSYNNIGVYGKCGNHYLYGCKGIHGEGDIGVFGDATQYHSRSTGVYGIGGAYGVLAESENHYGAFGWSRNGIGVYGVSIRSVGIYGSGRTYAIQGVGGNYGVVGSGTTAAFYATSGGYKFPDGTTQTTAAATSLSPACRICDSCGGSYPVHAGGFRITNAAGHMNGYGTNCTGSYADRGNHAELCCR